MMAPVAVLPARQRAGVGQALIRHGLSALELRSVSIVVTYGDPSFYGKVGFGPLPENVVAAPRPLSMPHGWLGQSLTGRPIPTLHGRPSCVAEFDDAAYW
jgi:predicted N-acetyltransferase YhbS